MYGATLRIYGGRCATNQIDPDQVTVAELVEYLLEKHNLVKLYNKAEPNVRHLLLKFSLPSALLINCVITLLNR